MKELILEKSTPAELQFNFEEFRESVRAELKKYDLVVTVDTLKDSKKLAADLNKVAAKIKKDFKEASALVTKPIDDIGVQVMSLVAEVLEAYENLKIQNKKFEDEQKEIIFDLLNNSLIFEWEKQGVHTEFCQVKDLSSLIKLGSITKGGKLTSSALQSIVAMVAQDKSLQDQTEKRLLLLENQSHRAGLKAPLNRAHVESFLFSGDDQYQANLDFIIRSEIERQDVSEKIIRETIQKEITVPVVESAVTVSIGNASRDGVTPEPEYKENAYGGIITEENEEPVIPDPSLDRINEVTGLTGNALMAIGLSKEQASKIMEMAYNGELHGLRMVY